MSNRWLVGLFALLLVLALPASALAQTTPEPTTAATDAAPLDGASPSPVEGGAGADDHERGGDNVALAVNTKDDSSLIKFAFDVRRVMNGVVDQSNAAVAVSSCEDCLTIAVAIQVVLVTSDPDVVTPENIAIALNTECTACETFASAYQYVFTTGGNVRFTGEGQQQINEIRRAIADLLEQDLDFATLDAELDALVEQLYAVIGTELVPVGPPEESEHVESETGSTPTPSDAAEPTPEPSDGSSVAPSESPAAEPTPEPSDT